LLAIVSEAVLVIGPSVPHWLSIGISAAAALKLTHESESAHAPIGAVHNLRIKVQVGSYLGEDEKCGSGTSAAGAANHDTKRGVRVCARTSC
jgi:hypothetical protein